MGEAVNSNITDILARHQLEREGDAAWVLTSSALVLLMTPGLAFFYGGLVRDTSIINTMMMSLISMGLISIVWMLIGFSLAFGDPGGSLGWFIGNFDYCLFHGLEDMRWSDTTIWAYAFATFQMTFAVIAAAIMSGALVERMNFGSYCVLIVFWVLLVYVPICHWVWGAGGWLAELGCKDFAGGTVVHVSSGTSGLVAALLLGPRKHHKQEGARPNNVPFVLLGAALLWFGWSGFNGGSALAADDEASRALCTTYLAAAAAMIVWVVIEWARMRQPSSVGAMVGAVAGLVVITPAAGFVTPAGAVCMGTLGAPACYFAVVALNRCDRLDDTLDAFGLHGVGGIVGALLTGIFAEDGGLIYVIFYGSKQTGLYWKQVVGVLAGFVYSAAATAALFCLLRAVMPVRADEHHERDGLDKAFHGESAYSTESLHGLCGSQEQVNSDDEDSLDEDGEDGTTE
mmetsp:Transcript_62036/g.181291  ORF Transcript_62036/g.181291 Transcript_62036/m.181291 type:complete len:457 (+) Transcript_62036:52-1422(+)